MYREGLLNAYAVRNAANGYGLVYASVLLGNDDALEYLNTLAVALLDLCVYLNGVADLQSSGRSLLSCCSDRTLTRSIF